MGGALLLCGCDPGCCWRHWRLTCIARLLPACVPLRLPSAGMPAQECEAALRDQKKKYEVAELAKGLQKLLSSYSGLMEGTCREGRGQAT